MRRTRRLILVLIGLILGCAGFTYYVQKTTQARNSPPKPAALPETVSARGSDWTHSETRDGVPIYHVSARSYRQDSSGSHIELDGVTLRMYAKDGKTFDQVTSAKADFDVGAGMLVSEGDVEITMGVAGDLAAPPEPAGKLIVIRTSGVRFESKTGKAWTEKPATFKFDRGEGSSIGAEYDPATRELHMRNQAQLKWFDASIPMEVQAGALVYKEAESKVWLLDWSRFKRATLTMEAGPSIVTLDKGAVRHVEAANARGQDLQKERTVEYSANRLDLQFTEKGAVEDVIGDGNAKLISTAASAQTTVTSNRLDLDFEPAGDETTLKKATAMGNSVVESQPVRKANVPPADTRILRSEVVSMHMRGGGQEIERVLAEAPGTIDFIPNRPGQKKRHIAGNGITINYGAGNHIQSFSATNVTTRTEPEAVKGKPQPPATTSSKGMSAEFEPDTGALAKIEQWDDFKYQEGDRQAKSDRAVLDQAKDQITLTGKARVWDPTGSTAANTIVMGQKSGNVDASGDVMSTRLPEKKQSSGMLSGSEAMQAKGSTMTSREDNQRIVYQGNALMWQGSNRLQADRIYIDRAGGSLEAQGNVLSQMLDKAESARQKGAAVFTVVRAPQMTYSDKSRLAHYQGGVILNRGSMVVNSKELRAFLKEEENGGSSLDHAVADGSVKIVNNSAQRTRTGTGEHAEYYVADSKVILEGGDPQLADSVKGVTKGRRLTYFSGSERLIVEGAETKPVESRILKKK